MIFHAKISESIFILLHLEIKNVIKFIGSKITELIGDIINRRLLNLLLRNNISMMIHFSQGARNNGKRKRGTKSYIQAHTSQEPFLVSFGELLYSG
ncbi:protein of unknown function [Legionella fallonii LLAP-10]|uniref:Uncharacterized protein n=1 Tax=Legionella fallonii LLAP-10 TaxID=1212491 RepID=A0A098G236_9GAMM|nr:protein of unknown function [Legionella fallonii LLAP-10]